MHRYVKTIHKLTQYFLPDQIEEGECIVQIVNSFFLI
jgi:hypothetical protein